MVLFMFKNVTESTQTKVLLRFKEKVLYHLLIESSNVTLLSHLQM